MCNRVAEVMRGTKDKGKGRADEAGALEYPVGPGELLSLWSIVADVCLPLSKRIWRDRGVSCFG